MNREVLKETFVSNGHSYANDALQSICTKIYPFNPMIILNHPNKEPYTEEVEKHVENQKNMVKLFNQLVFFGKEFCMMFIKNNWSLISNTHYID